MISEYNELESNLKRIHRFLKQNLEDHQTSDQRRFAYIACISALYSTFENFCEQTVFRFSQIVTADPARCTELQLKGLRSRYIKNSSALLGQSLGSGRYESITQLDVATSLASCLDESNTSPELRIELVAMHNSNLRWDALSDLFNWAEPNLMGMVQKSDSISAWRSRAPEIIESNLEAVLRKELEDLVERRNEVAHRAIPDEILSHEHMLAKVDYIRSVSLGLVASLARRAIEASFDSGDFVSLGAPSEVFHKGVIVVIPELKEAVSTGSTVVARSSDNVRWGTVQEIQISDETVSDAPAGSEASFRLDFRTPRKFTLHLWKDPDPEICTTPEGIFGSCGPYSNS